jgi:hypothetical protein
VPFTGVGNEGRVAPCALVQHLLKAFLFACGQRNRVALNDAPPCGAKKAPHPAGAEGLPIVGRAGPPWEERRLHSGALSLDSAIRDNGSNSKAAGHVSNQRLCLRPLRAVFSDGIVGRSNWQ